MPTALITGITGQDGSYLAELLLKKGYRVVGVWIDNAALWDVLADFLCSSQSAAQICIERHDDHADSHVGRLVWRHRVS